jgi:hypothetical protein
MNEQDTGAQTKGLVENQSQTAPVNCENPASSGKQQDKLRQVRENGRMHQPN